MKPYELLLEDELSGYNEASSEDDKRDLNEVIAEGEEDDNADSISN